MCSSNYFKYKRFPPILPDFKTADLNELPSILLSDVAKAIILLLFNKQVISERMILNLSVMSGDAFIVFSISFLTIDDNSLSGATE